MNAGLHKFSPTYALQLQGATRNEEFKMKTIDEIPSRTSVLVFLLFLLASCATATPDINLQSGNLEMSLNKPATGIVTLNASTRDPYVITSDIYISGSGGSVLRVWDISKGILVKSIKEEDGNVLASAISPDGRYLVTSFVSKHHSAGFGGVSDQDLSLRIRKLSTGEVIRSIPQFPACSVSFSSDGKYFVTRGGYGGKYEVKITVYETLTGKMIRTFTVPDKGAGPGGIYTGDAIFSPDGKYVLTGGTDGILRLFHIDSGRIEKTFEGHEGNSFGGINSISFSPDGKQILSSAFFDDFIILWDFKKGREIRRIEVSESILGRSVLSVDFSPDGKTAAFLVPFAVKFYDTESWQEIPVTLNFPAKIKISQTRDPAQFIYSPDSKRIFVNAGDAATRIFDASTGEEIAAMVAFDNGEWIFITSEGYYTTSPNGAKNLSVKMQGETYDVEKFYDVFYRPDIVMAKLRGENIEGLTTITMEDAIKSPPPVVEFIRAPKNTDSSKVEICYQAKSTGGGIGEVRLFHNGKLVHSDGFYKDIAKSSFKKAQIASLNSRAIYEDMRAISIQNQKDTIRVSGQPKGGVFGDCREIETISGENEVSVTAFNSSNTVQSFMKTISFRSSVILGEPNLYILSIGTDHYKDSSINLKYAAKDANEIKEKLRVQAATLYRPKNIHYELLTDTKATKTNITNKINELSKVIKPQDGFVLFVAGHGALIQNQYYVITHDYNGTADTNSMISSNEIVDMSKNIKSLSQLLIFDTCHAGGVDYIISGLYDSRMSVLAKKMGLHIYASASDKQTAIDGYKGNGLFSYSLLEGLKNNKRADANKDGRVSLVELGSYSKQTTVTLSEEIGHRQTPLIINFGKDSPIYQLK